MYLTRVEIQNIRAISHLVWEIEPENAAGWHVILGDNGAGKSTFVRASVLCCVGTEESVKLGHYYLYWLNNRPTEISGESKYKVDIVADGNLYKAHSYAECKILLNNDSHLWTAPEGTLAIVFAKEPEGSDFITAGNTSFILREEYEKSGGEKLVYAVPKDFFASFGPFRRFTGDVEDSDLFESNPVLRRHRTTFSEQFALFNTLKWLQQVQFKALEGDGVSRKLIDNIKAFVNQPDLLPYNTRMERVNSSGVHFVNGNGASVAAEELSDGYRSVLSLTFELLRLLSLTHGPDIFETGENGAITVAPPGVVLIDEVDAHLHPTWQKRIGFWLRKHFPKMQWIVTTHSPLICQAAEKGTIYKLPTPGTDETGRMLEGTERDRLVYGDILDAYSTEAFGAGITRSEASQEKLDRLSELNVKEIVSGLTPEESKEQETLRAMLPTTAAALPDEGLPV